jgi:hypothetical protein
MYKEVEMRIYKYQYMYDIWNTVGIIAEPPQVHSLRNREMGIPIDNDFLCLFASQKVCS